MDHFAYRNGILHAEEVPLADIAATIGTPTYVYASATLERHFTVFDQALEEIDHLVCFAVKANPNMAVLATLARLGSGADVVSGGELARALKAGIPAGRIVFSGVGKTAAEMAAALKAGILQFNVESEPELLLLNEVAAGLGLKARIAFRINPDVDARTHAKISTGKAENKFGIAWTRARAVYAEAAGLPAIAVAGVDVHIGSQLTELQPFEAAFTRIADLVAALRADGHEIATLDLGGGLGIPYQPDLPLPPSPADYGAVIRRLAAPLGCRVITEPGRLIAGNAGVLLCRVLYVKEGEARRFVILDAAMNDLLRPAMYDAFHAIEPVVAAAPGAPALRYDFVGPVCETGDTFARDRASTPLKAGDLVVLRSTGAYGAAMSSTYNSRPLAPEVLVSGDRFALVRRRQTLAEQFALEEPAPWLANAMADGG